MLERVGCKRQLSKEEVRDACSVSSQVLPEGMFAKAIKVLIWQGQLLRGLAQSAVQTELKSILESAFEHKQESNKRQRCGDHGMQRDSASPAESEEEISEESVEESKGAGRNFDLDDFLAPSCRACGWLSGNCSCLRNEDTEGQTASGKVEEVKAKLRREPSKSDAAASRAEGPVLREPNARRASKRALGIS
eukprot:CAMPEP_0181324546 /NCGR_PEP_ID=MMETSP1101-20121128/20421_1 /TAXON_ID=46948 /ORGANISM="Rhodomonas abbreviata, Strain Caron Lab Isolate" /LENGTH=191 /DNA_ID=CAMNT_0023432737 /DNA_START=261 /DNA_END=836 /DNA_ORIENTATION=+